MLEIAPPLDRALHDDTPGTLERPMPSAGHVISLPNDLVGALRRVWRRADGDDTSVVPAAELKGLANALSSEAKRLHLEPEQMIILIKRSYVEDSAQQDGRTRRTSQRALNAIVSSCIDEFFREDSIRLDTTADTRPEC